MSGTITLQYSADDLIYALRDRDLLQLRKRVVAALVLAILLGGIFCIVHGSYSWSSIANIMADTTFSVLLLLVLLELCRRWIWIPRQANSFLSERPHYKHPFKWHWDANELLVETGSEDSCFRWAGYRHWYQGRNALLLVTDDAIQFLPLNTEAQNHAANEIVAALKAAGVREKRKWP